jgi:nucleoside-diphosphate-sugar epimerase
MNLITGAKGLVGAHLLLHLLKNDEEVTALYRSENKKNQVKIFFKSYQVEELFEKEIDPTLKRGIISKKNTIDLFETADLEEVDGIYIWNGTDVFDKDEENIDIE